MDSAMKSKAELAVPFADVEAEAMTRERAVAGETYLLQFVSEQGVELPCLGVFIDKDGVVMAAGMDSRGMVAPIGARWVEFYKWQRKGH